MSRITALRSDRLTSSMVVFNFFQRRIAPLQACSHPAWFYTDEADATRLASSLGSVLQQEDISQLMKLAMDDGDLVTVFLPD